MRILDRYIGVTVAVQFFIVLLLLLGLFFFTFFIGELDEVGKNGYTIWQAVQYVLLTLPRVAYQLFPTVALLGSIIGLGILASNSELVVLRAAGVSPNRIVLSVLKVGLLLMVLATLLGDVLAPATEAQARTLKAASRDGKISLSTSEAFWARDGARFVYIGEFRYDGSMHDIMIYSLDDQHRLSNVIHAEEAWYVGDNWRLENISQSDISETGVTVSQRESLEMASLLSPDLVRVVSVNPEFLSAWGLFKYVQYLRANQLQSNRYELAFWRKIVTPLTTAVMMFLAIPFVFGPLRSAAIGSRIVVGTMVGIGFYVINELSGYVGLSYNLHPLLVVLAPPLLFLWLAVHLTRRQ